jgi:hypothetical protein
VIFDTNLATAYSEGQWERIQQNKRLFGFLEYVRSAASHPRHAPGVCRPGAAGRRSVLGRAHADQGIRLQVHGDPAHRRTLEREGLDGRPGAARGDARRTPTRERRDVAGAAGVDPAFNYPPGGRRAHLEQMLQEKLDAAGL